MSVAAWRNQGRRQPIVLWADSKTKIPNTGFTSLQRIDMHQSQKHSQQESYRQSQLPHKGLQQAGTRQHCSDAMPPQQELGEGGQNIEPAIN